MGSEDYIFVDHLRRNLKETFREFKEYDYIKSITKMRQQEAAKRYIELKNAVSKMKSHKKVINKDDV